MEAGAVKRRKYKRPLRIIERVCTRLAYPLIDSRLTNACRIAHPWYDTWLDDFEWDQTCEHCGSVHGPSGICVGTGIGF